MSVPTGGFFDYSNQEPLNQQNKDITIRFKCDGAIYFDDILVFEFNKTVEQFNPGMKDSNRGSAMVKLTPNLSQLFNGMGYPRIDPDTYELEWYVTRDKSDKITTAFLKENISLNDDEDGGDGFDPDTVE